MDVSEITQGEFNVASHKFPPNLWIRLAFKYFSVKTEKTNMKPKKWVSWILLSLFVVGFFATIFNLGSGIVATATLTYTGILVILGIFLGGAVIMNNFRIKKICKELGIDKWEYELLVGKFYPDESDVKYILK
jgi:uncharacterized membrane-anchored protein